MVHMGDDGDVPDIHENPAGRAGSFGARARRGSRSLAPPYRRRHAGRNVADTPDARSPVLVEPGFPQIES
jgi:hypothetical protein